MKSKETETITGNIVSSDSINSENPDIEKGSKVDKKKEKKKKKKSKTQQENQVISSPKPQLNDFFNVPLVTFIFISIFFFFFFFFFCEFLKNGKVDFKLNTQ